jgi:hypothetical protein
MTWARRDVELNVFLQAERPHQALLVRGKNCGHWLFAASVYIDAQCLQSGKILSLRPLMFSRLVAGNAPSPGKQARNQRPFAIASSITNVVGLLAAWQIFK